MPNLEDPTDTDTMRAMAIDRFGGVDEIKLHSLAVPEPGPDEVLIRIDTAGVGVWDPPDREGKLQKMRDTEASFPYTLGRDGSGIVVETGEQVSRFNNGDRVYVFGPPNPEANLYAEYATAKAHDVSRIPEGMSFEEAGALPTDAVTAFCGLDRALQLKQGESLLVFGASGGLGHFTVQFARLMKARVFGIASGDDGVSFVRDLGADGAADGKGDDFVRAARGFAPEGFDAALVTVGGEAADRAMMTVRERGRVAYPHGVDPEPQVPADVELKAFSGESSAEIFDKMNRLIESGPFRVHIDRMFPLEEAADAHRALDEHYLGRIALKVNDLKSDGV